MNISDKALTIVILNDLKPRARKVVDIMRKHYRPWLTSETIAKHLGEEHCNPLLWDMLHLGILESVPGKQSGHYWKLA